MNKQFRYSPEVREQAVRLVYENQGDYGSQWAAVTRRYSCCALYSRTTNEET